MKTSTNEKAKQQTEFLCLSLRWKEFNGEEKLENLETGEMK